MINIPQNVGKTDRIIRAVIGLIFIAIGWGLLKNGWFGILLNIIAAILLLNALTGKCFVYKLLKFSTILTDMNPPAQPSYAPPSQEQNTQPPEQTPPPQPPNLTQGQ